MFDKKYIYLYHHVHGLQQILRKIAFFQIERVESMVQIVLEKVHGMYLFHYLQGDFPMAGQDFVQRVCREVVSALQVEELAEGESAQIINPDDAVQLGVFFFQEHDRRAREDDFQFGELVVAFAQFLAPSVVLEHLVDEQHPSSVLHESGGKVHQPMSAEIEVVHVQVEAGAVGAEFLLGVLQQEGGLSYAPCALDADKPVVPVYLVHQSAADGSVGMLH